MKCVDATPLFESLKKNGETCLVWLKQVVCPPKIWKRDLFIVPFHLTYMAFFRSFIATYFHLGPTQKIIQYNFSTENHLYWKQFNNRDTLHKRIFDSVMKTLAKSILETTHILNISNYSAMHNKKFDEVSKYLRNFNSIDFFFWKWSE